MHTTSETLYLFFAALNIFTAGFCIGRSISIFEKKSKKTEEATSSSPCIRIVNLRCGLCRRLGDELAQPGADSPDKRVDTDDNPDHAADDRHD